MGYVGNCCDNFSRFALGFLLELMAQRRESRRDMIRDVFELFIPGVGASTTVRERVQDREDGNYGWTPLLPILHARIPRATWEESTVPNLFTT